ncbi:MAG TPA: hypothetical protein VGK89_06265 [Candidatus Eisenbacteria bacterium]|jgi:hypothetical protein
MMRGYRLSGFAALAALIAAGCGIQRNPLLVPNQPPEVELFAQRASPSTTGSFSYRLQWVGHDPDGRVDHFLYALGSPGSDNDAATWTSTAARERALSFPAGNARADRASTEAPEPSVFSVRAVDAAGAMSAPAQVAFFDGELAPRVEIVSPAPSTLMRRYVAPTFCVQWRGTAFDDDSSAERVVEYKYKLLSSTTDVSAITARLHPDSVRRYYAARNWPGWTSTRGRVTSAVLRNLTPEQEYVFVITCFDDEGNYDPLFSFDKNMLYLRVVYVTALPPRITLFNPFVHYVSGPSALDVNLEVPGGIPITFHWSAEASAGSRITGYRWALDLVTTPEDGDGDDEDGEHDDEAEGAGRWSRWSLTNTSAKVGPFAGGTIHKLYVEARANLGCEGGSEARALLVVRMSAVQAAYEKELLIVNDTRLYLDYIWPGTDCSHSANRPIGPWPSRAELDTFLFARGGVPWRCYPPVNGRSQLSPQGIFYGYPFDTLGTNFGISDLTVKLSTLARYRHVIWLVDARGALNFRNGTYGGDIYGPQTSMRYMNRPGGLNPLAAYVLQGGLVWLAGGGAATAATINFNKTSNDNAGPIPTLTLSNAAGELVPGRFVYDQAHWRSEFKQYTASVRFLRSLGRFDGRPGIYAGLPAEMQAKTPETDPLPPNRPPNPSNFYQTSFGFEFLSAPNEIVEDLDPGPHRDPHSTLDTLYVVKAGTLGQDQVNPVMTYYHGGRDNPPFLLTGFDLWSFRRSQCVQLVDFVLQQLWGIPPPTGPAVATPAKSRVPIGKLVRPADGPASAVVPGAARRD